MTFYSVRARLTLWYTAILAVVLITFSGISYILLARAIRAATDSSLLDTAHEFAAAFGERRSNAGDGSAVLSDFRYSDRAIFVFDSSGRIVASSHSSIPAADQRQIADTVHRGHRGLTTVPGGPEDDGIRVCSVPVTVSGVPYTVTVARDLNEQADRLESAAGAVFFGIPLALIVAAAGGYIMARKSLAPVTTMSLKARQIGAETLAERITVENERDELGFLASTLNELLERLQRAFDSQRRFMADASHELRTPLSIIQGESDVALSRAERSPDEYRESITIIQTAARKLTRIVESLFLLARSDAGRYPIAPSRFYLDELLGDCVRVMRTVAASRRIELTCSSSSELLIAADEGLIHRMVLNLVDNALKFTPSGGIVRVEARPSGTDYIIRVIDNGPGIPASEHELVFGRFYRGAATTAARTVAAGAGLGLPIARWIAEIHGGRLFLDDSAATGTTFVIVLPRGDDAADVNAATPAAQDDVASSRV